MGDNARRGVHYQKLMNDTEARVVDMESLLMKQDITTDRGICSLYHSVLCDGQ